MKKAPTKIVAIWTKRRSTLRESTESFLVFLNILKQFDNNLGVWYEKGFSQKEASKHKIVLEYDYMKKKACSTCNDDDYPEYAFDFNFWNGCLTDSESLSVRASIGGTGKVSNNLCILSLPYNGRIYDHYSISENWYELRNLFVDYWKAEKTRDINGQLILL